MFDELFWSRDGCFQVYCEFGVGTVFKQSGMETRTGSELCVLC